MSGNRWLRSLPLRDKSRLRPAALSPRPRYPSSFNSYVHSGPCGSSAVATQSMGSMKRAFILIESSRAPVRLHDSIDLKRRKSEASRTTTARWVRGEGVQSSRQMADYFELRARSAFSFLEGASPPEDLATRAAKLGYAAIALGDRDGVYGHPRFHQAAVAAGIKPIVGADLTLADESRLYVLVPDRTRYRNLCRLLTDSKLRIVGKEADGSPRYPAKGESRITFEDLERHGNGLICLAGSSRSPLARGLNRAEDVRSLAERLKRIFGAHNLFLDLQRHSDADEERLNRKLLALAETWRIPITATNDVCYAGADPRLADVLTCIGLGTTLEEAGRRLWINGERYLKAPSEMQAIWRDLPRALAATRTICAGCEFTLSDLGYRFPDYPLPPGETPDSYLHILTYRGARERWGIELDRDQRFRRQLEHELAIIEHLKLAGYFLIVWDIVQFCRENRIMVQGRGSAANSAVCYALGITAVDAVKMELLFERFLSEERGEWPDIDLDLPSGD